MVAIKAKSLMVISISMKSNVEVTCRLSAPERSETTAQLLGGPVDRRISSGAETCNTEICNFQDYTFFGQFQL
jgi:hypothetical protein